MHGARITLVVCTKYMTIIVCRLYVRAAAPLEGLSATMFDSSLHVVHVVPLVTGETKPHRRPVTLYFIV